MKYSKSIKRNIGAKMGRYFCLIGAAAFAVIISFGVALANDAVETKIDNYGDGVVTENGAFLVPGTYAIGTIKVDYFISGYKFPAELQKGFQMCLKAVAGKPKPPTNYPVDVFIEQIGSKNILLGVDPSSVNFTATGYVECVDVEVSIPETIAEDPDFQLDGTKLVGILQLSTLPGAKLDTVTTILVNLTLMHPSDTACVRPLHLVANQNLNGNLSADGIDLSFNTSNQNLNSSPNYPLHLLALVNSCEEDVSVDLLTTINENFPLFQTNAVRTTTIGQEIVDIAALLGGVLPDWDDFITNPQIMCLKNVLIPANQTFVLAQRLAINPAGDFPGNHAASLNPSRALGAWEYDNFTYAAHEVGAGDCATSALSSDVDPNTGEVSVPVNKVAFTGPSAPATEYPPAP